jgi:hypothetical protein
MRFAAYAVATAVRHPGRPIDYYYCPECGISLPFNARECPGCGLEVGHSPERRKMSAIPWWGSVCLIIVGIGCWTMSSCLDITSLDEAGRALVYIPLGNLFGMSLVR